MRESDLLAKKLYKCRFCGAPYAYRENLELHERGCPKRSAVPIDRYILPVALQREWIGRRERLWAEGKRLYEWSAGLYLEDGRITDRDYAVGPKEREAPWVELRKQLRPIGTVHSHVDLTGPSFEDMVRWVTVALTQIPGDLRPLFVITLPDDTFFAYMYPRPRRVDEVCRRALAMTPRIREKIEAWGFDPYESAQINAHYGMVRAGETKVWRRPRLGAVEQYFYLG